jgi:DUF4097 and DUF4098 domain-containing protein YvlB
MKTSITHKTLKSLLAVLLITLSPFERITAQSFTDKIVKELSFEKQSSSNALIVANINGSIKVEGYSGSKILIEAERTIHAKTSARLEQGKTEVQLLHINRIDSLIVYSSNGCNKFSYRKKNGKREWSYGWGIDSGDCDPPYDYVMNFSIKVPFGINVEVSTVNKGNVSIENVQGAVKANNVNGSIRLTALKGATKAHTINGNVDLDYASNPVEDCKYYTLNGDINAWFKKGLTANMSFKSYNGEFFTNVDQLESLPATIEKEQRSDGVKYKVNNSRYKISNGGANLDFETFNGNVILKER